MDPERQRIQDDLRGLVAGDVRCDDLFIQLYASDASVYQIKPLGVVRPRNTADVATVVRYAAEKRIPIHPRGAGTGLAGESLGPGLILDFSKSMRRIVAHRCRIGPRPARRRACAAERTSGVARPHLRPQSRQHQRHHDGQHDRHRWLRK